MKNFIGLFFLLWILFIPSLYSQSVFDKNRLEFGGIFGASFGNKTTSVKISPQVGYAFTDNFSAGLGVGYIYYDYDNRYSENYAGMNLYGRFRPWRYIMIQAQPEIYRTWGDSKSEIVTCFLIGGGVVFPVGNFGGVTLSLSYDLIQNDRSPYNDKIIYSLGYTIGF